MRTPAASGSDALIECGKDVAMQIAALNAQYLDKSTVPAEALAKEKEILVAQIQNDPKNANKARGHHCEDGGRPHRQVL